MPGTALVNEEPRSTRTGELLARCEMEVPRAKDVRSDADMAEVGVVSLEETLARVVSARSQFDSGVAVSQHPVAELEFEIRQHLVLGVHQEGLPLLQTPCPKRPIDHGPSGDVSLGHGSPAGERSSVEDRIEAGIRLGGFAGTEGQQTR